jgi:hypothetical protein
MVLTRDLGLAAWLLQLPKSRRPRVVYESHGLSVAVAREMPAVLGKPELAPSPGKLKRLDRREALVWRRAAAYVTITRALANELAASAGARQRVRGAGWRPPMARCPRRTPAVHRWVCGPSLSMERRGYLRPALTAPGVRALIVGGHPGERDLVASPGSSANSAFRRVTITGLLAPAAVRRLAAASVVLPNTPSDISNAIRRH